MPFLGTVLTVPSVGAPLSLEGVPPVSLPFPCSLQGSIQHATGAPVQGKHQINPACCWIVKISHILKLHATDLSLPCLLQGRSQHATEAPLHFVLSVFRRLLPRHSVR